MHGMDAQVKPAEAVQQEATQAFITLITSDNKEFSVPMSFIKACKTLEEALFKMPADESLKNCISSALISGDVFSLIEPYCAAIGKLHELRELRHALKLKHKIKVLNQERAAIYGTLYFALKKHSIEELSYLMQLADFCGMESFQTVLITMAYRLSQQELQTVPPHLVEKIQKKKAWRRASVLHWACSRGILDVVKDAIEQEGASINQESNWQSNSPLHCAAIQGDPTIVEYLLERGASCAAAICDSIEETPLYTACRHGNAQAVKVLLEKCPQTHHWNGVTALHLACQSNKETAELVYNCYRRLDDRDGDGETPLFVAAACNNEDTVRFLLDKGANVRATDRSGRSALHSACLNNPSLTVVEMLVEAGCPLIGDQRGVTPLHMTCCSIGCNNLPVVQYLTAQNGVDVHQKTTTPNAEFTPLSGACATNQLPIVQFLWEKCGCGFDDLEGKDLEKYKEPVRSYLKEQKASVERMQREWKEEDERLRERREQKRNSK